MILLGLTDLFAAMVLVARYSKWEIPVGMLVFIIVALISKSLLGIASIGGIIDLTVAAILITSSFLTLPPWIFIVGIIAIGQKGIASMFRY